MLLDEQLLSKAKALVEARLGWGNSSEWTNQDFIALSNKVQQQTGTPLSHITLKRLWGKVKYDGLPQTNTLNILAQFLGYESWRDFAVKNKDEGAAETGSPTAASQPGDARTATEKLEAPSREGARSRFSGTPVAGSHAPGKSGLRRMMPMLLAILLVAVITTFVILLPSLKQRVDPADYSFSSKATVKAGIPSSVIFNFNAEKAPADSVIIQQSWDKRLRTTVSKHEHEHTLLYYFPGYFQPKLIVQDQVVKEHGLLIPSDGWLAAYVRMPMPVYFSKEDIMNDGKLSLPLDKIKEQNVSLSPDAPKLSFCNVKDFGEIYTDDFTFETSVRNDYREGSSVCQLTDIYILAQGAAVHIPLCAKGCESALDMFFTSYEVSGKKKDLSAFGVDFNSFVKVKIESRNGKAVIFVNDKPAFTVDHDITKEKIIGIDIVFQGTGSVDYVQLSNGKLSYHDEF